jgi:hypothetical protein
MPLEDVLGGLFQRAGVETRDPDGTIVSPQVTVDRLTRKALTPVATPQFTPRTRAPLSTETAPTTPQATPDVDDWITPPEQAAEADDWITPDEPVKPRAPLVDTRPVLTPDLAKLQPPGGAGPDVAVYKNGKRGEDADTPRTPSERPNAFMRGLVSGTLEQNPETMAETMEGLGRLSGEGPMGDILRGGEKELRKVKGLRPDQYKTTGTGFWNIAGIDDAMTWAGETLGQGMASSIPSILPAAGGAAIGGRVAGRPGAVAGAAGGAFTGSFALNYGEVYKALKDEKVDPDRAAELSIYAGAGMAALDSWNPTALIAKLGGLNEVRRDVARHVARRVAAEAAKGAGREGLTEAAQEAVKEATIAYETGKPLLTVETAKKVIEAGAGGALTGGVMAGPTGLRPDTVNAPAQAPAGALGGPAGSAGASAAPGPQPSAGPQPGPTPGENVDDVDAAEFLRRAQEAPQPEAPPAPPPSREEQLRDYFKTEKGLSDDQVDALMRGMRPEDIDRAYQETGKARAAAGEAPQPDTASAEGPDQAAPEAGAQQTAADESSPDSAPPGHTRFYHGGDDPASGGGRWVTTDPEYARNFRAEGQPNEVHYVDIPKGDPAEVAARSWDDVDERAGTNAVGNYHHTELPEAWAKRMRPLAPQADGTRANPIAITSAADVAAAKGDPDHTPAQGAANNRALGHGKFEGFNVSIEAADGGVRRGTAKDGTAWEQTFPKGVSYGYIKGIKGADGDQLDIFFGPKTGQTKEVYVLNENGRGTNRHRQTKSFAGFETEADVRAAYAGSSGKSESDIHSITAMPLDEWKQWVKKGNHKARAPVAVEKKRTASGASRPLTVLQYIASRGGLKPDGDLRAAGLNSKYRVVVPGMGYRGVLRGAGMSMDEAVEELQAAGYLPADASNRPGDTGAHARIRELIDEELRGRPAMAQGEEGSDQEDFDRANYARGEEQLADRLEEIDNEIEAADIPGDSISQEQRRRAAIIMATEGLDAGNALEQAIMREAVEAEVATPEQIDDIYGAGTHDAVQSAAAHENDEVSEPSGDTRGEEAGEVVRSVDEDGVSEGLDDWTQPTEGDGRAEPGEEVAAEPATSSAPSNEGAKSDTLADAFAAHMESGEGFPNILQARRFAQNHDGSTDAKIVEEALELAVVKTARKIVQDGENQNAIFDKLVDLYGRQPRLGTRTSTSMRDQAFSTPVPLAYVASRLAQITPDKEVMEPTAGNGALLIEANPDKAFVNELNPKRAANLETMGFKPSSVDASEKGFATGIINVAMGADVVITNPPFGVTRDDAGTSKNYDLSDIQPGYRTNEIDHVIALRSLAAMHGKGGRGVLILGGLNKLAKTTEQRSDGYNGKAKREFYKTLYDRYNVVDHFTVAGELYERQGAGWPVDVIVIDGRGKSGRKLPAVDVPRVLTSWDQLKGLLDGERSAESRAGSEVGATASDAAGSEPSSGDAGVPADVVSKGRGSRRGDDVQPAGVRAEPVPVGERDGGDRQSRAGEGLQSAERGDADRAGAQPDAIDFDAAFDAALDDVFGTKPTPKNRPTKKVLRDTVASAAESADAAMAGLVQMFGGPKVSSGMSFDPETYAKAKPLFQQAATKFADFANNVSELVKRMVAEMQRVHGLTRDGLEAMRAYLRQFVADVQSGAIRLGEAVKEAVAPKAAKQEQATATQLEYKPQSGVQGLGTLVPVNMKSSIEQALASLEESVGNLETFVAKELGYPVADVGSYFAAEQVDALALAIDNMKRGKGFIIGDQTGIGKGRVNAGIIRWAHRNEFVPVFVTEKPNLYGDMYRDLTDTGFADYLGREPRILMTNSGETIPLDEEGKAKLRSPDSKTHNNNLLGLNSETFRAQHDVAFTTYSQMQTVAEKETARRQFLRSIAPNAVFIFDESHNAGGQKASSFMGKKADDGAAKGGRAGLARELIGASGRVFYSSATYAKRPDVMDLYSATDMSMAVANPSELGEAIARGGVPMQQAVASMLAEAGQYIRRERSFAGVTYDTPVIETDHEQYNGISGSLADIQAFSIIVKAVTKKVSEGLKGDAGAASMNSGTGDAGASSLNFTAVMHNLINQMLLAMKVGPAADRAVADIKAGRKPVLTVANTMESFLNDYAEEQGIAQGGVVEADFGRVLHRYLERTRTITIKKPFMAKGEKAERKRLTDADLGSAGVAAYHKAKAAIEALDLSNLPLSPIDALKGRIEKAGYSVGEITGRGTIIDYSGAQPRLRSRPGTELSIRGRRANIAGFNSGKLDAIVINQAGATGLSLHASEKFKDQRKRKMLIVQAEANIDTHMQMLGRVHRTGQVVTPEYEQLVADIPAEKRPAAVLAKKMASLNANTTASRGGALTAKDVPDFVNEYGDMIAFAMMSEQPDLHKRLGDPLGRGETFLPIDAMRKVTGRIPLLPLKLQEELYEQLEAEYTDLLKQMDASGENALEAKTIDFKAVTKERTEVVPARSDSASPFAKSVTMEKVDVARLGKPYTWEQVEAKVAAALNTTVVPGEYFDGIAREAQTAREKKAIGAFDVYKREVLDDVEDPKLAEQGRVKLDAVKDRWRAIHAIVSVGARVTLRTTSGNLSGVVLNVEQKGKPKNPLALSTWKATIAVPDASRQITLSFSRLWEKDKSDSENDMAVEIETTPDWIENVEQTRARFEHMQTEAREDRYIATGNILAAYDYLNKKGQVINFTDADGNIRQGVLTGRQFDLAEHAADKAVPIGDAAAVKAWLDAHPPRTLLEDSQGRVHIVKLGTDYAIEARRAKRVGGEFFLDKQLTDITGDFASSGPFMRVTVDPADIQRAIDRMIAIGARFVAPKEGGLETQVASARPLADARRRPALTQAAQNRRAELEAELTGLIRHLAGPEIRVEFQDSIAIEGTIGYGEYGKTVTNAGGTYVLGDSGVMHAEPIIRLALADPRFDVGSSAVHEAFHAIEDRILEPRERGLLNAEADRLRAYIKQARIARDSWVDGLAPYEVNAVAFEVYTAQRADGGATGINLHIGIRRIFDRITAFLRAVANYLRGQGFQTAEDIFADAYAGKYAKTPLRGESAFMDEVQRAKAAQFGRVSDQLAAAPRSPAEKAVLDRIVGSDEKATRRQSFNSLYTAAKDDLNPIRLLRNALADGATLPAAQDPYKLARLTRGSSGRSTTFIQNATFDFNYNTVGPGLKQIIEPVKNDLDGLRIYLVAKRALELHDRGIRTGVPHAEAQQSVIDGQAKYQPIADGLTAYQTTLLEYMRDAGILSDESFAAMLTANRDYVPFFRLMGDKSELGGQAGAGLKVRNPIKGIRGSDRQIIDPIESIVKNTFLFIALAERNRALLALADLADSAGTLGEEFMPKVKMGVHPIEVTEEEVAKFLRSEGLDPTAAQSFTIFRPNAFRPAPDQIALFRDGKREVRKVAPEVAEAVQALDRETLNGAIKFLSIPARMLRRGAVLSPEFIARNPLRDQNTAFTYSENGYVPFYDLVRGIGHIIGHTKTFQDWMRSGGANATMVAMDRDYISANIIRLENPKLLSRAGNVLFSPLKALEVLSELLENGTRVGDFARGRKKGKSLADTGYNSREVTLDFARVGAQARAVNSLIAFWNAQVEGVDREIRGVADHPWRTLFRMAIAITIPSLLLWAVNADDDRYKELPDFQKNLFWIILTDKWEPHQLFRGGRWVDATDEDVKRAGSPNYYRKVNGRWMVNKGTIYRLPKPHAPGLMFGSLPERILDVYTGKNPDSLKGIAKTIFGTFVPGFIPQFALPIIEQFSNRSTFTDRNIVPKYLEDKSQRYQAQPYTSDLAKIIGYSISRIDRLVGGTGDVGLASPLVVENYIRAWTGGLGMHVVSLMDAGLKAAGAAPSKVMPAPTSSDTILIKAFTVRFPSSGSQSIQSFYDTYEERDRAVKTAAWLAKSGRPAEANELRAERNMGTAKGIKDALGVQMKLARDTWDNPRLSADDKRKLMDSIYLQSTDLARMGVKILKTIDTRQRQRATQ